MHTVIKLSDGTYKVVVIRDAIQLNILHGLTARDALLIAGWLNGSGKELPQHLDDNFLDERFSITKSTSEAESESAQMRQSNREKYDH